MRELWRPIIGYEDRYAVSNKGRVVSLKSWDVNKREFVPTIKVLTPTDNGNGYLIIGLKANNKRKNHYIHRLVAEHFVPNPKGCGCVNHIDYNQRNNYCDNLEWCTQRQNVCHSAERMRKPHNTKPSKDTNEKYIRFHNNGYELTINATHTGLKHWSRHKTLSEAVALRDALLKEVV